MRFVERRRQEAAAEVDLEAELLDLRLRLVAEARVLLETLLHLLSVGDDHLEEERVVDLAGEPLGGTALGDPRLQHPHDVHGRLIPGAHRPLQRLVELLLDRHRAVLDASPSTGKPARPPDQEVSGSAPLSLYHRYILCTRNASSSVGLDMISISMI